MSRSNSFSFVGCEEVAAYPAIPYYSDWRDAMYELDYFPVRDDEVFDIKRFKTKVCKPTDLSYGPLKLSGVYVDCLAHENCTFRWKVLHASGDQIRELCDESFIGDLGFIFQQKNGIDHAAT